jgi:hypothetical protein
VNIEIVVAIGLVFAAAALARFAYEREMDVLYGPYIEGRNARLGLRAVLKPLMLVANRLRF